MEKNQGRTVTVTAKKIGINGEGIAYLEGKPVFVDQLLPGKRPRLFSSTRSRGMRKDRL